MPHLRNLKVPKHIHEMFKKGGADRTQLQELLKEAKLDKDLSTLQPFNNYAAKPRAGNIICKAIVIILM